MYIEQLEMQGFKAFETGTVQFQHPGAMRKPFDNLTEPLLNFDRG